jgi:hypothetical protein
VGTPLEAGLGEKRAKDDSGEAKTEEGMDEAEDGAGDEKSELGESVKVGEAASSSAVANVEVLISFLPLSPLNHFN